MKLNDQIMKLRMQLAELNKNFNSDAVIGSKMTLTERNKCKSLIQKLIVYIDKITFESTLKKIPKSKLKK